MILHKYFNEINTCHYLKYCLGSEEENDALMVIPIVDCLLKLGHFEELLSGPTFI